MKEALAARDKKTMNGVLFVIEMGHFSEMKANVRKVAWSVDDRLIQIAATITLWSLKDVDGLRDIAKNHPQKNVRQAAERQIASLEKNK